MSRGPIDTHDIRVHTAAPREYLAIGIPSFGMVHLFWVARLLHLRIPPNIAVRWIYCVGKEVGEARNEIVARALEAEQADPPMRCKAVFFLDDDVLIHPDCLLQLWSRQRPIVGGLYYFKTSVPQPMALLEDGAGILQSWTPGALIEVAGHGMGCTLIDADVFRRVRDAGDLGVDPHGYPAWFKTTRDQGVDRPDGGQITANQTEDMYFLARARALGFQPAVDTAPQAFAWHFDARTGQGYPMAQWREWHETRRITWPTPDGPVVWETAA